MAQTKFSTSDKVGIVGYIMKWQQWCILGFLQLALLGYWVCLFSSDSPWHLLLLLLPVSLFCSCCLLLLLLLLLYRSCLCVSAFASRLLLLTFIPCAAATVLISCAIFACSLLCFGHLTV